MNVITVIYTLSLHDALPISRGQQFRVRGAIRVRLTRGLTAPSSIDLVRRSAPRQTTPTPTHRSEEHTSELQSHHDLVCRLLLEKKKNSLARVTVQIPMTIEE